jgi:MFS family permease
MLISRSIRTGVLTIHGVLALGLGLAFFYLSATMTNMFFEAFAVIVAIMLAAAALTLAAITDWFAAFSSGMKSVHRITFYLLAGIAFALAGVFLAYYPDVYMQWLVAFAAIHALAFGISALVFAFNAQHYPRERRAMFAFGSMSVLFSGAMAGWIKYLDDRSATVMFGAYLCFVGLKILFFAWNSHHAAMKPRKLIETGVALA